MRNSFLILLLVLMSGCATTPRTDRQTFEERYEQQTSTVKKCIYGSIVAILAIPVKGFDEMNHVCDKE